MDKKGVFVKFTIALQVFILLFAAAVIPASAASDAPQSPLVLSGNVELNGAPAPVGTEITAELNDKLIGKNTVTSEGVYGDEFGHSFFITCDPADYDDVIIYVNGGVAQMSDSMADANPLDRLNIDLVASTPTGSGEASSTPTTSGGGFSSSTADSTSTENEASSASGDDAETDLKSTTGDSTASTGSEEDVPATEKKSSLATIGYISIALIALIGIIATVKYKSGN